MYVRKEYLYYQIASMGNNYSVEAHRGSWTEYLEEHFKIIETGFQFPRLAVQEPQGVMILRVSGASINKCIQGATISLIKSRQVTPMSNRHSFVLFFIPMYLGAYSPCYIPPTPTPLSPGV